MRRLSHAAKALVTGASVLMVCAAGAAQTTSNDPLSIIPAESLFCVKINNLSGTLGKVDQFLAGAVPVPPLSMMVTPQLGKLLGSPDANGVNLAGNFALFGPLPGGDQGSFSRVAALIPVSNYDQFVKANKNVTPPDAQGISTIGEGLHALVAAKVGDYAMVTAAGNRQAMIEGKTLLASAGAVPLGKKLSPDELKRANRSPIWAYANLQTIDKIAEPMLQKKIDEIKQSLHTTTPQGAPMMDQMDAIANMYFTTLTGLMRQTQFVSLSLDPSASAVHASLVTMAMPDSEMGKIFNMVNAGQQLKYLDYLENGAVMNCDTTTSPAFFKAISEKYANLAVAIMGPNAPPEDAAKIKQFVADAMDAFSGTMAMSFSADLKSKPPFKVTYAAAVKDKKKLYDTMDQAVKMMNEGAIAEFYKKMGMKMHLDRKPNAETYQGVSIDAMHMTIEPADTNSPEGQMIKNIYGEGLDLRLAVVNDLMLYVLSPEADKAIHALIDQAKATTPRPIASEVEAALQLLPDAKSADFFGTYNFLRLIQMAMAMMPMPLPPMDVATQSDVAFSGQIGGGKLQVGVVIPKQHVLEIMMAVMKMQQSMMQKQQPTPQPGQPSQNQPQSSPRGQM
jgi:hypothetical protein